MLMGKFQQPVAPQATPTTQPVIPTRQNSAISADIVQIQLPNSVPEPVANEMTSRNHGGFTVTPRTFRVEHVKQLSRVQELNNSNGETELKWLEIDELFKTTENASKEDLAANSPHHSTTSLSVESKDDSPPQCCVCLSDEATILILPCRHVCMCTDCFQGSSDEAQQQQTRQAKQVQTRQAAENCEFIQVNVTCNICPVCRTKVRSWVEIIKPQSQ